MLFGSAAWVVVGEAVVVEPRKLAWLGLAVQVVEPDN